MSFFPHPPTGGWPSWLTEALNSFRQQVLDAISGIRVRTTQAGRINLTVSALPPVGEVKCDGKLYTKTGLPELARVCGTTFNTGGETAEQFRVPNIAGPVAGTEFRISTG